MWRNTPIFLGVSRRAGAAHDRVEEASLGQSIFQLHLGLRTTPYQTISDWSEKGEAIGIRLVLQPNLFGNEPSNHVK